MVDNPVFAQFLDAETLKFFATAAGPTAVVGWAVQFFLWKMEREDRKEAQLFILKMLETTVAEKVNGTNAVASLTSAVNAVIALVRGGQAP